MYNYLCKALLESGVRLIYFTSPSIARHLESLKGEYRSFHFELATDEKIAFELAFAGAIASKRTACIYSTEEIFGAMDPIMTSAYTGVKKGFLIVCVKETPHEASFIGLFSKIPVLSIDNIYDIPSTIDYCFKLSEKYEIPVLVEISPYEEGLEEKREPADKTDSLNRNDNAQFIKDPGRWAATPSFRYGLHQALNKKIEEIRNEFETYKGNEIRIKEKTGIITTKKTYMDFYDEDISTLKITTVFPLPYKLVDKFISGMDEVFLIEDECPTIELQIKDREKIKSEIMKVPSKIRKREEALYGFYTIRDWFGPASSINIAHGIKKTDHKKKILAITYENHFLHSGTPAFVNVLYNASSFILLIIGGEKEKDIRRFMEGCGFKNFFNINNLEQIKDFNDKEGLIVLFFRGMI